MATMRNKSVGFNIESPAEKEMLDYCEKVPNFSKWVKGLVWRELQRTKQQASGSNVTQTADGSYQLRVQQK